MKIALNRAIRRTAWGGGAHFASAFADFLTKTGHQVVHQLEDGIDVIVMLDPRYEEGGFDVNQIYDYKLRNHRTKVLHRINDTGVTRGGKQLDDMIINSNYAVADATVFISRWVADYFVSKGYSPKNNLISAITNGCDKQFFYPPHQGILHSPLRLVTHHWSDNENKGLDLYKHIDELLQEQDYPNIKFTYIGRYPKAYTPKKTTIINPLYGKELGDELRRHDVYVTAARSEACGSHHVEGAACGMPVIYHRDGGGVVEMCSRYGIGINDPTEFESALEQVIKSYRTLCDKAIKTDLSSDIMCQKYLEVIVRMVS